MSGHKLCDGVYAELRKWCSSERGRGAEGTAAGRPKSRMVIVDAGEITDEDLLLHARAL